MIEGEEIFESANETGYRLCTSEKEIDNSIFSASWDKNDHKRMFICSQKGQLRVINTEHDGVLKYEIIFRRYTTYENSADEQEKLIPDHWDRMVTIPDRPNEIIFLLGMSKALYYTALPGSDSSSTATNVSYPKDTSVVIAGATRPNFPGFLHGTPVTEIAGHTARIVSLAVSPAGHVLASGDELGNVRLLLLQLLDELSIIRKKEQRKRRHVVERQFNPFLPSYNISHKAHSHSVFSLEWLPLIQTKNDVRYYGLVTGSQDSAVRIWTVTCCSKKGLTITPCQSLNTMSTGVMCLSSYLLVDRQMEIQIARMLEGAKTQDLDDRHRDPYLPVRKQSNVRETHELNNAKSVYLAAGTDKGTIYVWKLHFHSIQKQLLVAAGVVVKDVPPVGAYAAESDDEEEDEDESGVIQDPFSDEVRIRKARIQPTTPRFTSFAIDDGTALHSLMQTSENPIIHVSITNNGSQNISSLEQLASNRTVDTSRLGNSDHILLAASDTSGLARLHTVDLTATDDARNSAGFSLNLSKNEQAMQQSAENTISRIKSSLHRASGGSDLDRQISSLGGMHSGAGGAISSGLVNNNKPLVPAARTLQFPAAVVACAFQTFNVIRDEASRSTNNSGTNTPTSSMSPSHIKFNASSSNQNSPAGSVSSGRGGMGSGSIFGMLTLNPRTPALAIVCSDGLIKLFATENMQTLLNGNLAGHDGSADQLLTAPSSTTASSPASSEHSLPTPVISARRSRTGSANSSVGNASNVSPNSSRGGGRGNVLFSSPAAAALTIQTTSGSSRGRPAVTHQREEPSEIEARVSPIPRIQQTGGPAGVSQKAIRPEPVRGGDASVVSSQKQASTTNIKNNTTSTTSSASSFTGATKTSKDAQFKRQSSSSSVPAASAPSPPPVLNVGGGVMFKTNVAVAATLKNAINNASTTNSNNNTTLRSREDDSLSFPHRAGGNNTSTINTNSKHITAVNTQQQQQQRRLVSEEDDSSITDLEPRRPLSAATIKTSKTNTQHSALTSKSITRPVTQQPVATRPSTAATSAPTNQQASQMPAAQAKNPEEWTYERMSTQYTNDLAMASFHTIKIQKNQLNRLQDDDVTVSTLQTTASDQRAAARATVRNQPLGDNRYSFLTSATTNTAADVANSSKNKTGTRIAKQTDPSYLARKQYGGPNEEDLKMLRPKDPLVGRDLYFIPSIPQSGSGMRRSAAVSSSGKQTRGQNNVWDSVDTGVGTVTTAALNAAQNNTHRYNSEFGLYCDMDKTTLQPRFRTEVNANDILGRVDVLRSMQVGRTKALEMRDENAFSLIAAAFV